MLNVYYGKDSVSNERFVFSEAEKGLSGEAKKIFLLVPDQYILEAEKNAFRYIKNLRSVFDIEVLSFKKLMRKIFDLCGSPRGEYLNEANKNMILSKVIIENDERLHSIKNNSKKLSALKKISYQIEELKAYDISAGKLKIIAYEASKKGGKFYRKVEDLILIYEKYEESIKDKFNDQNDFFNALREKVLGAGSEAVKDAAVWIYEFDLFSEAHKKIIFALAEKAKEVNLVFLSDYTSKSSGLINSQMDEFLDKAGVRKFPIAAEEREKNVEIVRAKDYYEEIITAAIDIRKLVESGEHRYKDIKIVAGDLEENSAMIKNILSVFDIPFFIDRSESILASPISVFAHSLISLAINKSDRDALFRLLKTGLLEIESGTKNEEIINEIRENNYRLSDIEDRGKFKEIIEFINSFRAARTAHGKIKILSEKIEAAGDIEKGKKIVEMLSGIGAFLGETRIKNDEFLTIVSDGIMSINIGVLPPAQDIVIVGDIKRSRSSNIKVLFMLGVNDGIIPSAKKENSFLLEAEKRLLSSQSPIGKTPEILLEEENIAIKKNLAVPSEKLILSYSTSSRGSEALYESVIIKNARQKGKASERESYSENSYEFVRNEKTARLFLASKPENKAVRALSLFADASNEKSFNPGEKKMRGRGLTEKFSGAGVISLSASSLEKYSRCPYSFFLAKMLELKEERIRDFTGTDFGQIYHKILQDFFLSLGEKKYMVGGEISRGEVAAATERIFESEMAKYKEGLLTISEYQKYKAARIKKTAVAGVFDIYSEFALAAEAGESFAEVTFEHGKTLSPLAIGKGYEAHGRIDRYDRLGSELRVIDYKTYGKELFPKNILSGYDMQLMVYSLALTQNAGGSVPASPYYIELKDMAMKDKSLSYKLNGIKGLSKMKEEERKEELAKLAGAFMRKTEKTFDDFSSGIITPRPLTSVEPSMGGRITACTYCPYASVCHYDAERINMRI